MSLSSFFRISAPSAEKVPQEEIPGTYRKFRNRTFWGMTISYSIYYMCRLSLSVIKQPIIDSGYLTAGQLGIIGSVFLYVYAIGKFLNGFISDYCNLRRFMATGLILSSIINLVLGFFGMFSDKGAVPAVVVLISFSILWAMNGWGQSMGSSPGVISLSRWFSLENRGTFYSIFCATPFIGEFISFLVIGFVASALGWQYGFIVSAAAGLIGVAVILFLVSDNPESKGLPSVQEYYGETPSTTDGMETKKQQLRVLRHPGIWIIAVSSAFIYITKYAVANWGVLFLQKAKSMSLESASSVIAFSSAFGILGTVTAGWLSDKVFSGDRLKPAVISGLISFIALGLFLFSGGGYVINVVYISVFSLAVGVLFCIVAGLMALDIVPRKATGAAVGTIGVFSYIAAGIQDLTSGFLIEGNIDKSVDVSMATYDFTPVSIFWLASAFLAFFLPALNWTRIKSRIQTNQ